MNIGICGQLYNQNEETPVHERVDRLDMWIAIRGMINQKKIFLWIQETVDREMREGAVSKALKKRISKKEITLLRSKKDK
ncbi:hypothetical protein P5G61_30865, partial [Paenibacillus sp. F6_3S_P_1C]|nr:hypothetical protein [Paenibacillus vandeheii]